MRKKSQQLFIFKILQKVTNLSKYIFKWNKTVKKFMIFTETPFHFDIIIIDVHIIAILYPFFRKPYYFGWRSAKFIRIVTDLDISVRTLLSAVLFSCIIPLRSIYISFSYCLHSANWTKRKIIFVRPICCTSISYLR